MLGPCDYHCAPGFTEEEARAYHAKACPGLDVVVIMPEDEWEALCNAKYGDKWPALKAKREKDDE